MEVEIIVWQFVRIMVDFEEFRLSNIGKSAVKRNNPIFNDLKHLWVELDEKLELLAKNDHLKYSKIMMNEYVKFDVRSKSQLNELISSVSRVINKLKASIKSMNNDNLESLNYEKDKMSILKKQLISYKSKFE
ncbi:hypothetical protein OAK17_07820 [Alphaproteobacteria bacterium]|nr:hypothetical protein [Alphaproteobacteria bacterium]